MKNIKKLIASILIISIIVVPVYLYTDRVQASTKPAVQYYFPRAGQAPEPVLVSIISSAKKTLDIAIYSITDQAIGNAIIADKKRGVVVRIISDKTESGNKYQKALLTTLKNAKIPIKINSHSGLMHMKVTIVDNSVVTTGSFNYSNAAETTNDEVFVVLNNSTEAKDFDNEFVSMWNNTSKFKNF